MAEVKITIKIHMEIPKSWHLVKHTDGKILMDIGDGQFLDMAFTPMLTSKESDAKLASVYDEPFAKKILAMITGYKTKMERVS